MLKPLKYGVLFRNEIEDLEHKVARERERYQISTQSMSDGISAIPMMPVNDSVSLKIRILLRILQQKQKRLNAVRNLRFYH